MDTLRCAPFVLLVLYSHLPGMFAAKGRACDWIICNRRQRRESFSCENAAIFVENVTDFRGAANHVAYQNIKQMCMGASTCDPTRMCLSLRHELLRVRYVCVDVSPVHEECVWPVEAIWRQQGHIRSPNYPAAFPAESCSWRITAPEDRFVHISVHDVTLLSPSGYCDSGLNITYQECSTGHVMSRLFCGSIDDRNELIACGSVSIQLFSNMQFLRVRFWLSYEVTSSPEAAVRSPLLKFVGRCTHGVKSYSQVLSSHVVQRPVLRTLLTSVTMPTSSLSSTVFSTTKTSVMRTSTSSNDRKDTDITVVIIVVSTIGAVLVMAIILAVIFLKRPKIERVEHVYAVPSTCDSSTGSPPKNSGTLKHERPILRDCYCEVADAIPSPRLNANPASPGYAEVEDVCKGDNCRWDPHKFTFGPTIRVNEFPFSKPPNVSSFSSPYVKENTGVPLHLRTLSDSTPMRGYLESPYLTRSTQGRSFRDPKCHDYEDVVIDSARRSPCLVLKDQQDLLQSRLSRATAAAKSSPHTVKRVPAKPFIPAEGLYATSNVINDISQTQLDIQNRTSGENSPPVFTELNNSFDLPKPLKDSTVPVKPPGKSHSTKVPERKERSSKSHSSKSHGQKSHRKSNSKGDNSLVSGRQHRTSVK